MRPAVYRPPTPADLAAIAARWATLRPSQEDETTVVISGYEPDVFHVWSGRGPDVRSILRRAGDRILELEEHPHGIRFTFPRAALASTGAAALLRSEARVKASRERPTGFAPSMTGPGDAPARPGGAA
ncbi:MAG: hypothetical protein JXB39_06005 [Deltaproteobacteria bacterium]|nr:hypothetical protein [Deltaproteobacteria bacterium]